MIIYRYEFPDGGGPFINRQGVSRTHPEIVFNDHTLYGCTSIEALKEWFSSRRMMINPEWRIMKYEGEVLHSYGTSGEVIIDEKTAVCLGPVE